MIRLRVVDPADMDLIFQWENNPEFWPYSASSGPFTLEEIAQFIDECSDLEKHRQCRFLITSELKQTPLGALDIFDYNEVQKTAGIGILIVDEADRRQGFAREAIQEILESQEIKRRIRLLWCIIHTDNTRSLRLFETCGFTIQGETNYNGKKAFRLTRLL